MGTYYIGADVHSNSTELAIEKKGEIVGRYTVPTSIQAISNVLDSIQGKKYLAVEEGPKAPSRPKIYSIWFYPAWLLSVLALCRLE